ncbi:hypothetical protein [Stagnimonas aquatica]|uniref:hypothetical protein n=1 Tax=Stagnimonas aquatica TaxID=2689987 RepID=UPI0011CDEC4E|nr:hypothetical protein [Stagnimonas aquatica]
MNTARMPSSTPRKPDPVRELYRQASAVGVAVGKLQTILKHHEPGDGSAFAFGWIVSRKNVSGQIFELSTNGPGPRRTVRLLLTGDRIYVGLPRTEKLAKRINSLTAKRRPTKAKA